DCQQGFEGRRGGHRPRHFWVITGESYRPPRGADLLNDTRLQHVSPSRFAEASSARSQLLQCWAAGKNCAILLAARRAELGFAGVWDLGPGDANAGYFAGRGDGLRGADIAHLLNA